MSNCDNNNDKLDHADYLVYQQQKFKQWESKCGRCGACCGATDGDPCENLGQDAEGKYICKIYEYRFGLRRTVSGKEFHCVPIRDILHLSWPGDSCCGYKKGSPPIEAYIEPN